MGKITFALFALIAFGGFQANGHTVAGYPRQLLGQVAGDGIKYQVSGIRTPVAGYELRVTGGIVQTDNTPAPLKNFKDLNSTSPSNYKGTQSTGNWQLATDNSPLNSADTALNILPSKNIFHLRLDSIQRTVPIAYNDFVQHYIDIYTGRKVQIGKMLGLSKYYFPIFERALIQAGVPEEIKFITIVESALEPHAVSRSGAVGPWQFMYATAKGYGLTMDSFVDERKDPIKASAAAAHYLSDAYRRIGDWLLAIAAFNCGTGAVTRAIERSGGVADFWLVRPFLPRETQNYVPAFIATMYVMNYHKQHGIEAIVPDFNVFTDVIDVTKQLSISSIAKAADLDVKELLYLNPSYKKQIVNGTQSSPKSLVVPQVSRESFAALYDVLNGTAGSVQVSAASVSPEQDEIFYKVKSGQTLLQIANIYGVEVQDLKVWNKLKSITIVPGQTIRVRANEEYVKEKKSPEFLTYIVKAGDTLSEIAARFKGATVTGIKALNGLSKSTLQPGMSLKINKG